MIKSIPDLLKAAVTGFLADNATRMSAALAYYAVFSLAPLIIIIISVVGFVYGEEAARGQVVDQISGLVGEQAGETIQTAVAATAETKSSGIIATIIAVGVMIFGASTVFAELKNSLNTIWGVEVKPGRTIITLVRDRALSFSLVLTIGFLLVVSLLVSAALSAVSTYMAGILPLPPFVWKSLDFAVSLGVGGALFAMIYKILPNVILNWRDVMPGALLTALLFTGGKSVLAWYLGSNSVASSFSAAGSLIVILLWVYYAACILFFGAEFSKVCLLHRGRSIVPHRHAKFLHDH
jgi:membrane protein